MHRLAGGDRPVRPARRAAGIDYDPGREHLLIVGSDGALTISGPDLNGPLDIRSVVEAAW